MLNAPIEKLKSTDSKNWDELIHFNIKIDKNVVIGRQDKIKYGLKQSIPKQQLMRIQTNTSSNLR